MIFLNLKNYPTSVTNADVLTEIAKDVASESGIRVVICPPVVQLKRCAEISQNVFAQHVDAAKLGSTTGFLPVDVLKLINVKGSLLNHSERRLGIEAVKKTTELLRAANLEVLVCAESPKESAEIAKLSPDYVAVEPPELIGSGISVSSAKPEVITATIEAVRKVNKRVIPLCGAGVSTREDVANALKLGAKGVLLASAFVNAKDPKAFLQDLVAAF